MRYRDVKDEGGDSGTGSFLPKSYEDHSIGGYYLTNIWWRHDFVGDDLHLGNQLLIEINGDIEMTGIAQWIWGDIKQRVAIEIVDLHENQI